MYVNIEVYLLHFCYQDKLTKSAKFRVRADRFQPIIPVRMNISKKLMPFPFLQNPKLAVDKI